MSLPAPSHVWSLDTTSWLDSVGGLTLTGNGSPTVAAGKLGNAVSLSSALSQYLFVSDPADLRGSNSRFFSVWVKPSVVTGGNFPMVFSKEGTGVGSYSLFHFDGVGFCWRVYDAAGTSHDLTKSGVMVAGNWYHIVAWYNEFTGEIGIDVNNSGSPATTTIPGIQQTVGVDFLVGARQWSGSLLPWDGLIDEPVFFPNAVPTTTDISDLYGGGAGLAYPYGGGGGIKSIFRPLSPFGGLSVPTRRIVT